MARARSLKTSPPGAASWLSERGGAEISASQNKINRSRESSNLACGLNHAELLDGKNAQ